MEKFVWVGVFGLLGVYARYLTSLGVGHWISHPIPIATIFVNLLGSFLMGVVYVLGVEKTLIPLDIKVGIMVGFLGGFTTFSSYSMEGVYLIEKGLSLQAMIYLFMSPVLGFISALGGLSITRGLIRFL